jgi:hypothetical protein
MMMNAALTEKWLGGRFAGALTTCAIVTLLVGCGSTSRRPDIAYFPAPPNEPRVVHLKSFNALDELAPIHGTVRDRLLGGSPAPSVGTPAGLGFQDNHLYICDTALNVVHDWNLATGDARRVGAGGDGKLQKPVAIAVDDAKWLYVADSERGEVLAFNSAGLLKFRMKPPNCQTYRPTAIALSGVEIRVTDIIRHKLDSYSRDDGTYVRSDGEPGQFYFPSGVAEIEEHPFNLAISDMMNSRVQIVDICGRSVRSFGQPGDRYGDLGKPKHLAVGPDGVVFITDPEFGVVHLFNHEGQLLMVLGDAEDRRGRTAMPFGVVIARTLPERLAAWVPDDFHAAYFLFVSNTVGANRLSLYAVGNRR